MGGLVLSILVWQEGGEAVGLLLAIGVVSLTAFAWWLVRRKREGKPTLVDPDLFKSMLFRFGISGQLLQNVALGGAMITIPIYLQMVLEYNALQSGLSIAPLSLSMFGTAILAGRRSGNRRPSSIIRAGFALLLVGLLALIPVIPRADAGYYLAIPLIVAGIGPSGNRPWPGGPSRGLTVWLSGNPYSEAQSGRKLKELYAEWVVIGRARLERGKRG